MVNCDMIRSSEVAGGAAYSQSQPDFNLRIIKGNQLTGINTTKLMEFMQGEMGIKIASDGNLRQQITKARKLIVRTYEGRKLENRKEHVLAVRAADTYKGDVQNGMIMANSIQPALAIFASMEQDALEFTAIDTEVGNQLRLRTAV